MNKWPVLIFSFFLLASCSGSYHLHKAVKKGAISISDRSERISTKIEVARDTSFFMPIRNIVRDTIKVLSEDCEACVKLHGHKIEKTLKATLDTACADI